MSHQQAEPPSHLLGADTTSGPGGVEDQAEELSCPPQLAVHASLEQRAPNQRNPSAATPTSLHL